MARTRIPNYIVRKTGWLLVGNWWFVLFFALEAFLVLCHCQALPIEWTTVNIVGMELSMWTVILAIWTLIFLVAVIWKLVVLRCQYVEFYDTYVVQKKGVIIRKSKKVIFPQIISVETERKFLGYGHVRINVVGPWDLEGEPFEYIKRPEDVREYLVDHMVNSVAVENIGNNPYIATLDNIF